MEVIDLKTNSMIAELVKLVSKKRKAILAKPCNSVRISGTYWDGGSRSDYFLIRIADKKVTPLAHQAQPQFGGPREDPIQVLEPGYVVIEAGVFQGKPSTPVVYMHREEDAV